MDIFWKKLSFCLPACCGFDCCAVTLSASFFSFGVFVEKHSVSLKTLLQQGISKPNFYSDFRKTMKENLTFRSYSENLITVIKEIGYSLDIMRQTACLVVNPFIVGGYDSLFNCTTAVRGSDSMMASVKV